MKKSYNKNLVGRTPDKIKFRTYGETGLPEDKTLLGIIQTGLLSQFWLDFLKPFLEQKVDSLEYRILRDDELSEKVEITKRDLMRQEWGIWRELLDNPAKIVKESKEEDGTPDKPNMMEN